MKGSEIRKGDRFEDGPVGTHYTVEDYEIDNPKGTISVLVRFDVDGGQAIRVFGLDQEVPFVPAHPLIRDEPRPLTPQEQAEFKAAQDKLKP